MGALIRVAFAFGRFNGPTCEHEKLLDLVNAYNRRKRYVFVSGPLSTDNTDQRNPLTVYEKLGILAHLYPNIDLRPACGKTARPDGALSFVYRNETRTYEFVDLAVIAGDGDAGVEGDDGGSASEYRSLLLRLNNTKYPIRNTVEGTTVGGDYRMNYRDVEIVANPRGNVSGTALRTAIRQGAGLQELKPMFHSRMTDLQIENVVRLIRERSKAWTTLK